MLKETRADLIQTESLVSLSTLAANIAHEISNSIYSVSGVIAPIQSLVDTLNCDEKKDELTRFLGVMKHGLNLTEMVVFNLKNYSGENKTQLKKLNVKSLLDSVLILTKSKVPPNIAIRTSVDQDIELYGNAVRFYQILTNLVFNAIDAMPDGGEILISVSALDNACEIIVKDTGKGIPEEMRERMFEPFVTTKAQGKGTGLGLYIVKAELDKQGAKISVLSEVGKGSEFRLTIPSVSQVL